MAAVQPEPWLWPLITNNNNNNVSKVTLNTRIRASNLGLFNERRNIKKRKQYCGFRRVLVFAKGYY
jgi:hypothetical protein